MDGKIVEDPTGVLPLAKQIERASKYPSAQTYIYASKIAQDCTGRGQNTPYSVWQEQQMCYPWINPVGTGGILWKLPETDPNAPKPTIQDIVRTGPYSAPGAPNIVKTGGY